MTNRRRTTWAQLFLTLAILALLLLSHQTVKAQDNAAAGSATVSVSSLNVRKGPGISYEKLGLTHAGDVLAVKGKFGACDWLYVQTPEGIVGWVAGSSRYVQLVTACADLPVVNPDTAETAQVASEGTADATTTPSATPEATISTDTAVVEPTATPSPAVVFYGTVVPADKGCIAWGNYVGPDILVTATHQKSHEIIETKLANNMVTVVCYDKGPWTVTMSPISNRFRDLMFELEINAGDTFDWPFVIRY